MKLRNPMKLFLKAILFELDAGIRHKDFKDLGIAFSNEGDIEEEFGRLFRKENPYSKLLDDELITELKELIKGRILACPPYRERLANDVRWHGKYPFQTVFLCWVAATAIDLMDEIAFD